MMQSNLERNGQLSVICLNKDNDIDKYIIKSEKNHSKKEKTLRIDIIRMLYYTDVHFMISTYILLYLYFYLVCTFLVACA